MPEYKKEILKNGFYQNERKVFITFVLVTCIFVLKFCGAIYTNSLALYSDSWHLLTDIASLLFSWWGLRQARKAATCRYTFGYYRHGVLTAFINNITLICVSVFIFYSAVQRYFHPASVEPRGMILIALCGLLFNGIIALTLHRNTKNLTVKSVFLHFIGDALSDFGVLLGGIIIRFTGLNGIDTLLSAVLACLILRNAVKMTSECVSILLEGAPSNVPIPQLIHDLERVETVISATDVHIWSLSKENLAMTAHICSSNTDVKDCEIILHKIQHLLKEKYQIEHSTIQFEHCTCGSCYHSKPDHRQCCMMCIHNCADPSVLNNG